MELLMQCSKTMLGNVCINLGCGEIAVTEKQLHHSQIGAMIQQMCRKCMPKRMG